MLKNLKRNKKGFTLVELIIVIAIIGILAAVLVPTMIGVVNKANASKAGQELVNLQATFASAAALTNNVTTEAKILNEIAADDEMVKLFFANPLPSPLALKTGIAFAYADDSGVITISSDSNKKDAVIYVFKGTKDAITGWVGAVKLLKVQSLNSSTGAEFKKDTYGRTGAIVDETQWKLAV